MNDPENEYLDPKKNPFIRTGFEDDPPEKTDGPKTNDRVPIIKTWKGENIIAYDDIREAVQILLITEKADCPVEISLINDEIYLNKAPLNDDTPSDIVFSVLEAAKKIKSEEKIKQYIDPAQNPFIKTD